MTTAVIKPRKSLEPWLKDDVEYYDHQVTGIRTLLRWNSFILADDMGLGKSLQALTVFCADIKEGRGHVGLIICPVSLRANWVDEIEKFTRIPYILLGEEYSPRTGKMKVLSAADRTKQIIEFCLQQGPKILILNYDQVKAHAAELNAISPHAIIYDEAHSIKTHNSGRTEACLELQADRHFMLTGTPMLNRPDELWPLLNKISPKHFPNYYSFTNRYCVYGGHKGKQIVGVKNRKQLHAILEQVMLRRLKDDVLDLPEEQIIKVPVGLHPNQRRLYDMVDLEQRLENFDPNGDEEKMKSALTSFMRLQQIADTPLCVGHPDDSYKLDAVVEKAEALVNRSGERITVFTRYRGVVDAVEQRFKNAKIPHISITGGVAASERLPLVKRWTDSDPSALICMSQVGGVGLNMTAGRIMFKIDKLYVPGLEQQIVDRMRRIGQQSTQPVQIYEFYAKGTVEGRIEEILRGKKKLFEDVIDGTSMVSKLLKALQEQS